MVNTFITSGCLLESVRSLDSRRLGKQRVEAQQILNALENAKYLAKYLSLPSVPLKGGIKGDILREQWYANVWKEYKVHLKSEGLAGLERNGKKIGFGFVFHPMTKMWIGYEKALKMYINACIVEWVSRGFSNNMKFHVIIGDPVIPWWVSSKHLHGSHISALLRKEKVRKEKEWYVHLFRKDEYYAFGYLWVCNLSYQDRVLLKNSDIPKKEWFAEITNDFDPDTDPDF